MQNCIKAVLHFVFLATCSVIVSCDGSSTSNTSDTTPPTVSLIGAPSAVTALQPASFRVTADDNETGVEKVEVYLVPVNSGSAHQASTLSSTQQEGDGSTIGICSGTPGGSGEPAMPSYDQTCTATFPPEQAGSYQLTAKAQDAAGNVSTTSQPIKIGPHPFTPYSGTYYPIYYSGGTQWMEPTTSMPFDKISVLYIAFAHAYPAGDNPNAAVLNWDPTQPDEPARVQQLVQIAKQKNPDIKILVTLGWGQNDWDYISKDITSGANQFVPSIIKLIQQYGLDGFDIDDESLAAPPNGPNPSSGSIAQSDFDTLMGNIRNSLNEAATNATAIAKSANQSSPDVHYYFTITPAGNNYIDNQGFAQTQVNVTNMAYFDLINIQTYYGDFWTSQFLEELMSSGDAFNRISVGINAEASTSQNSNGNYSCNTDTIILPGWYNSLMAGAFSWNFVADYICNFAGTNLISKTVSSVKS